MHAFYQFITGPMAWASFALFFAGCLYRLVSMIRLANRTEKFIFSYLSLKYGFRSILHWLIPFGTESWRQHPWLTIVTFAFHSCLIITPLFLLSHIVLWEERWNIRWWALPDTLADVMTFIVIMSCIFFLVRRRVSPEVRFVTDPSDYFILAIVIAPFLTGFLAYHQWFAYRFFVLFHILSGEIMLAVIPFTRLSHMVFSPLTRIYMGSEFGGIRHAKDW